MAPLNFAGYSNDNNMPQMLPFRLPTLNLVSPSPQLAQGSPQPEAYRANGLSSKFAGETAFDPSSYPTLEEGMRQIEDTNRLQEAAEALLLLSRRQVHMCQVCKFRGSSQAKVDRHLCVRIPLPAASIRLIHSQFSKAHRPHLRQITRSKRWQPITRGHMFRVHLSRANIMLRVILCRANIMFRVHFWKLPTVVRTAKIFAPPNKT